MRRKNLFRLLIVLLPLVWFAVGAPTQLAQKNSSADFDKTIQPFLAENCIACHSAKKASGELNLDQFKTVAAVTEHREQWEHVLLKLRTGEMPPKGAPRPDAAELKAVM
ncbi:MAG: c-type cytochrome domain-containing protein, partial [Blastocatellia bacterium]